MDIKRCVGSSGLSSRVATSDSDPREINYTVRRFCEFENSGRHDLSFPCIPGACGWCEEQPVQDHPGRFGVFALLSMPHVDQALKEIPYAFDVLRCDGMPFMTRRRERFLGGKTFAPVMDELHHRKAAVYTHPNKPACCRNFAPSVPSVITSVIIEYGIDTTPTLASVIFSGTSARCKDINFVFSHGQWRHA